jgi:TRAP-type C4-dicarboxylate transport system permease small subunit
MSSETSSSTERLGSLEPAAPSDATSRAAPQSPPPEAPLLQVDDGPVDLSDTPLEGWIALGLFWLLGATVAVQFFTRYALNDSAAWTEEIARYLLIGTVFVGASVGVARNNHIQVDFLYRYLPPRVGRSLALLVDVLRVAFFVCMVVTTAVMMLEIGDHEMVVIDLPMNVLYGLCELAWLAMTWRSARVAWMHYRRGYSSLERPEQFD